MHHLPAMLAVVCTALGAGCQSAVELRSAGLDHTSGVAASARGDHLQAVTHFARAVTSAEAGGASASALATSYYTYGRELALVGEFAAAETALSRSLELERRVAPPREWAVMQITSLLGYIHLDTGRPLAALGYFERTAELMAGPAGDATPGADRLHVLEDLRTAARLSTPARDTGEWDLQIARLLESVPDVGAASDFDRFTPAAVAARMGADSSPDEYRPR